MYAKLLNGVLEYAPINLNTGEHLIINFNKNISLMKQYEFKELIDIKPDYDNTIQYLSIEGYIENEDTITINYKINEIEINNESTLEERVRELEKHNANIIATVTCQLSRYLEKKIITQQEHDELIALMEAKELVVGE